MKIIAFEGLDKSGKASSLAHLADLLSKDYKVGQMDFHRYNTDIGQIIMKWLRKENTLSQEAIELLMAADKVAAKSDFLVLEEAGYDFLLLDRYKMSQKVYALASGVDPHLVDTLQSVIPDPDYTIYLDVPPAVSMARRGKHGDNDRYESDFILLENVRKRYLHEYVINEVPSVIIDGSQPLNLVFEEIEREALPTIIEML